MERLVVVFCEIVDWRKMDESRELGTTVRSSLLDWKSPIIYIFELKGNLQSAVFASRRTLE